VRLSSRSLLLVNNFPGPGIGGGEVLTLNVAKAAADAGMDVTVVTVPEAPLADAALERGYDVYQLPMRASAFRRDARALAGVVDEIEPDLVQGTGFLTNALVRTACRVSSVAVVDTVQADPEAAAHEGASALAMSYRRWLHARSATRSDAVAAVSRAVADSIVAWGSPAERVRVIHNGVDIAEIERLARGTRPATADESGAPLVASVGRLEPVKGMTTLVRAAAGVSRVRPDVRFAIAGTGSLEGRLREIAVASGTSDRIDFLGHISPIETLLSKADVLVLPSLSEGLPIAPLEAMALGVPVVASDAGGIPEVVEDGVTGVLVATGDHEGLSRAILDLVDAPERAEQMGAAGRRRVEERFTIERMQRQYVELYEKLLSGSS
jgi:glycosyltransferase involved in cell wall biosynthesis